MERWLVVLAVLLLGVLWWLRPREEASAVTSQARPAVLVEDEDPSSSVPSRLAEQSLERIAPSTVDYVTRRDGRWVLRFVDGSEREVYPFEVGYLPEEIRLRMDYRRGGP
ncbi:hypothetical protein DV704_09330 [Meiothermus sp. QL-1]|uniref:hypothetical protein n=1 Tax=Meiothermus sp. QL-1 TaxID=2058095 RepID=UPI000E0C1209|nr:hypothetical protein [Meiothermus sp. QL-1]RDI95051.1 hypothetical protein DV704_09330 [Meiothermus sp. QL-1]